MPTNAKANSKKPAKKKIRGKGWKKSINVSSDKYDVISKAILKVLTKTPIRFSELTAKVKKQIEVASRRPRLPQEKFTGSVSWYTITTLRELESAGKVVRTKGKTVTYSKQ